MKRKGWRLVQLVVTLTLMIVLLRSVDWSALARFGALQGWWLAGTAMLFLACHLVYVWRWQGLIRESTLCFRRLLVYYGAGLFANNFLPTGLGGDGVRAALLARHVPTARAIVATGLDRAIGLVSFSALLIAGLWLGPLPGLSMTESVPNIAVIAGFAAIALGLAWLVWRVFRTRSSRWHEQWVAFRNARSWLQWLGSLALAYGLSVFANGLLALAHWCTFQAFSLRLEPAAAVWLVLIGSLSLLLPIAINGLGVMESVYVLVLTRYSMTVNDALAVALTVRVLMIGFSLLGGLVSLLWRTQFLKRQTA